MNVVCYFAISSSMVRLAKQLIANSPCSVQLPWEARKVLLKNSKMGLQMFDVSKKDRQQTWSARRQGEMLQGTSAVCRDTGGGGALAGARLWCGGGLSVC